MAPVASQLLPCSEGQLHVLQAGQGREQFTSWIKQSCRVTVSSSNNVVQEILARSLGPWGVLPPTGMATCILGPRSILAIEPATRRVVPGS